MAYHILYIPWAYPGEANEQYDKCVDWQNSGVSKELKHNFNYVIVTHGDGTSLATLPWFSEIYIRGHGSPGGHKIDNDVNGTSSLKYDEVAERLLSHGLKRTWCGVIKLYNCHSGECTLGSQSFAAKFAQYMRFKKNYHLISYVGYVGELTSYPVKEGIESHHKHKFSILMRGTDKETWVKTKWCKLFF